MAFDGVGGDVSPVLLARLGPGGRYLPHGGASGRWGVVDRDDLARRGVEVVPLSAVAATPAEAFALVEEVLHLAGSGVLRPTIGQVRPLEDAAAAHAAIEARSIVGKTLLIVSSRAEAPSSLTDEFGPRGSS